MTLLIQLSMLPVLVIIFYQDWKYRAVSVLLFPLLLAFSFGLFFLLSEVKLLLVLNTLFLITIMLCLFVYISIRKGTLTNIFKADFGLGDLLFFVSIIPLLVNQNYILFFISGMLLSGVFHLLFFHKKYNPRIPLAGYLSLYLILWITADIFFKNQFLYTEII